MKHALILFVIVLISCTGKPKVMPDTTFCTHKVVLDEQNKIIPWYYTRMKMLMIIFFTCDGILLKTKFPIHQDPIHRSRYPQYYFYCAFNVRNDSILPDAWMNDIGEKIPNWFENARLYYAYTGDSSVMKIMKDFIDYTLEHGTSSPEFAWPGFPYTTTNAGDTLFRGFSNAGRAGTCMKYRLTMQVKWV